MIRRDLFNGLISGFPGGLSVFFSAIGHRSYSKHTNRYLGSGIDIVSIQFNMNFLATMKLCDFYPHLAIKIVKQEVKAYISIITFLHHYHWIHVQTL